MFRKKDLVTTDIQTLIRKCLHHAARMIWQEHRDYDDVLPNILDLFYLSDWSHAQPRYCEDNWQSVLVDDMKALGCPCSIERETDSMRSNGQDCWTVHLPEFNFWITESIYDDDKVTYRYLSFFPQSASLFGKNNWGLTADSAQTLAFINTHYGTICRMLDQEILRASVSEKMTEILETTWGSSVNTETRRLSEGIHSQKDDFSCEVRYFENRLQISVYISNSWMETGWYSRHHYIRDIPYEKIDNVLPVWIDAILAGNIDRLK